MTARIRLLYLVPGLGAGGTERLVSDLTTSLDPARFEVVVCAQTNGAVGDELRRRGVPVHALAEEGVSRTSNRIGKLRSFADRARRLRAIVATARIDVVHSHHLGALLHAFAAGLPSRRWGWVHTEHIRPDVDAEYPGWLVGASRWLVSSPDVVTGVSDAVGDYFRESIGVADDRLRVIYNGIDVDRFARPSDGNAKRRELSIEPGAWVIGVIGSLRAQKNHELLLRAFVEVLREAPEARLMIVGDGELRASLEATAAALGIVDAVRFLGVRADVAELLAAFDVVCLPSRYEGMPLTVFEAMAAGKPVVATDVLGIREVVADGETGLLTPSDSATDLAAALLRLRADRELGRRLGESARHYVETNARLERMIERYAALYEQVVASRPSVS